MDKIMFSSASEVWSTPQYLFDEWNKKYQFNTDVCALPENTKCEHFFTPEIDGLNQKWVGKCWMNPPYGKVIYQWVKKAFEESKNGNATVVALLPARTDTKWFHDFIYDKIGVECLFIKGRLKFSNSKNAAPFPSMIVIFNCQVTEIINQMPVFQVKNVV